jgi:O-antigen/teichoic acid export membrane protein
LIIAINLPIFKWFIPNEAYWEGLTIVPILLLANVFLGIYYNQSIWYKLADKTKYGAYISIGGATVTILLNLVLIPYLGYMGAAITTLFVYFSMMAASFYYGHKIYPIKYNLRKIVLYLGAAILLFGINQILFKNQTDFTGVSFFVKVILIVIFVGIILFMERPFKTLKKR